MRAGVSERGFLRSGQSLHGRKEHFEFGAGKIVSEEGKAEGSDVCAESG